MQPGPDPAVPDEEGPSFGETDTAALLGMDPLPTWNSPLPPIRQHGDVTVLDKLKVWLTQRGCSLGSDIPAPFEVDENRHREQEDEGLVSDLSVRSRRASLSSTIVHPDLDPEVPIDGSPGEQILGTVGIAENSGTSWSHQTQYVCGLRRDIFENLLANTRKTLKDVTKPNADYPPRLSDEKLDNDASAVTTYILKDDDLRRSMARVVRILEGLHHASILSLDEQEQRTRAAERVSIAIPKAILPQAPREADTATTITLPQTYITPRGSQEPPNASASQPAAEPEGLTTTTTTLVSHSTVTTKTEINWVTSSRVASMPGGINRLSAPHASSGSRPRSVGNHSHAKDTVGGGADQNVRASVGNITFQPQDNQASRRPSAIEAAAARAHVESYPSAEPSIGSSQGSIISFPALRTRHCTNDWLTPPATTPGAMGLGDANLYRVGIDARTGPNPFFAPKSASDAPLAPPPVTTTDSTFTLPVFAKGTDARAGSKDHTHRLGTSIGTSAGRKRSNHTPPDADAGSSSTLQKLRQGSAHIGHAVGSAVRAAGKSQETQQAAKGRRAASVDQMKALLDRASVQHDRMDASDHLPRLQMAGGKHKHRASDTCSEDGRPHICSDEIMSWSGSQAPSVGSGV